LFVRIDEPAQQLAEVVLALTPTERRPIQMVEANHSLQQAALRARLAQAATTLARREAEKAVKMALKRQRLKPQYIETRSL
jgi:hypothetical protein